MLRALAVLAPLALVVGCTQRFYVETDPPGADVYIGGTLKGKSPLACKVTGPNAFSGTLEVMARMPGYFPAQSSTGWGMTWYLTREWSQTRHYLKLHKTEEQKQFEEKESGKSN